MLSFSMDVIDILCVWVFTCMSPGVINIQDASQSSMTLGTGDLGELTSWMELYGRVVLSSFGVISRKYKKTRSCNAMWCIRCL